MIAIPYDVGVLSHCRKISDLESMNEAVCEQFRPGDAGGQVKPTSEYELTTSAHQADPQKKNKEWIIRQINYLIFPFMISSLITIASDQATCNQNRGFEISMPCFSAAPASSAKTLEYNSEGLPACHANHANEKDHKKQYQWTSTIDVQPTMLAKYAMPCGKGICRKYHTAQE